MVSVKTMLVTCAIAVLLSSVSEARISLNALEGVYEGPIEFPTVVSMTEEGRITNFCRERFSQECLEEMGLPLERIVINETSLSLSIYQTPGIRTRNQSIEAYPSCAPGGMYPVEFIGEAPPYLIQSYDPTTGHLMIDDPMRPDNDNCVIITPGENSIRAKYIVTLDVLPEIVGFGLGPIFRCIVYNGLCISETSIEGNFVSFVSVEYELPCISGACLNNTRK